MSNNNPAAENSTAAGAVPGGPAPARVGTIVWGLIVLALAALTIIAQLGLVVLNGTYVLIGLMIGAGAALVLGGVLSARKRDNGSATGKP
ncbi:hypothetical protein ACIQCM_05145 [Pseudarthrobacter sp. NPDC092439]|uniref:hypothetical protein n=1 Tax=unclassified Pseudarthrobacter TaxID=2647000 RepID=UPI0038233908